MKKSFLFLMLLIGIQACMPSKELPKLNINQLIDDIKILSADDMQGRLVGTEGNEKAREYITKRLVDMAIPAFEGDYNHHFTITRRNGDVVNGINIISSIKGEIDSIIVISAHYDHLGVRDSLIFNGADDNASGIGGLLATADYFSKVKPKHTLIFAAFDAEEGGLNGARSFVQDSILLDKIKLNVNMDMISNNDRNEIYAVGTYHYPFLKPVLETVDTGELTLSFGHDTPDLGYNDWTMSSDHGPFHEKGIPFIYFGVEDHEHYHKATDEFKTIPQEFYKKSVQLILNAIIELDKM